MSRIRQRLQLLLQVDDSPHRIALAFGVGVWIAFFPILGIHTGMALAIAFAFKLNRVAILLGTWVNNPWTIAPMYTAGTLLGCMLTGVSPAGLQEIDWGGMGGGSFRETFRRAMHALAPFLWPYCLGNTLLGFAGGAASYFALRGFLEKGVQPAVLEAYRGALLALEGAGAQLVEISLPHFPHAIATYYIVATAEASSNLARFDGVRYGLRASNARELRGMYGETRDAGFGPEVKRRIILGTFVLSSGYHDAYYVKAQKVRSLIRGDFEKAFAACDVVATPTTTSPAFRLGEKTSDPLQMYLEDIFTVPANLAGVPGLSVPCGFASGLPVGLQLLGRPFDEATLLRAAGALELATDHHRLVAAL